MRGSGSPFIYILLFFFLHFFFIFSFWRSKNFMQIPIWTMINNNLMRGGSNRRYAEKRKKEWKKKNVYTQRNTIRTSETATTKLIWWWLYCVCTSMRSDQFIICIRIYIYFNTANRSTFVNEMNRKRSVFVTLKSDTDNEVRLKLSTNRNN
jgi:hypothetical protein